MLRDLLTVALKGAISTCAVMRGADVASLPSAEVREAVSGPEAVRDTSSSLCRLGQQGRPPFRRNPWAQRSQGIQLVNSNTLERELFVTLIIIFRFFNVINAFEMI